MMPSEKSSEIDNLIKHLMGKDRKQTISTGGCMTCERNALLLGFRDNLSAKEYTISGMCQKCQDEVFGA